MPFADLSKFEKNPELTSLSDLFTVDMITQYIQGKLGEGLVFAKQSAVGSQGLATATQRKSPSGHRNWLIADC